MKRVIKHTKRIITNATMRSTVLALTTMYLLFGVLNAGFILVQVLFSVGEFFLNHLPFFGNIINHG